MVVTTGAGSGTLGILVDGPAKVAVVCTEVDEGYEFSYTPTAPGDYFIAIKYCNVTIAGCPHKAVIAGQSLLTAQRLQFLYVRLHERTIVIIFSCFLFNGRSSW